ncbi:HAD-IIA family hydrolase [Nakamurella sp. YIM 132087]|uniref:HAD-IIA family hydrolase n=1 Tax=Nakamurella alba TaxID=2665158 RepID=A0A7K1FRC0_9ACTN|nr:HAD-IIA family hydrolase [Nakamurella alba]MTD16620.1 HAD-IIA family hydrolase [Nakamurella alba]
MRKPLVDEFDVLLLDLDGTVYLGGQVIPHVPESLAEAARRGARPMFVTNNASRSPADVAGTLTGMGVPAAAADVLTSPEVAAAMLAATHPAGSAVLVVGAQALADAVSHVGLVPVRLATDAPVAVVQGHSPDTGWRDLAEACIALRDPSVDWVASNTDTTLPTDRGLLPGNGSMVAALVAATGRTPRVAGKPNRPLLDEGVRRAGASRPLVVGDRLDTDLEAAVTAGMPGLMVLTGVSGPADLLAAVPAQRPTHLAFDLRGLLDQGLVAEIADVDDPSPWTVTVQGDVLVLAGESGGEAAADLRALAALARSAWASGITAVRADGPSAAATLQRLGLSGP